MNNVKQKLLRDEIKRIIFLKKEIKIILLKSIKKNQQLKPFLQNFSQYKLQLNNTYFCRQKNYCIITGRSGGVFKMTNTSRQVINKLAVTGLLTNMKANNFK